MVNGENVDREKEDRYRRTHCFIDASCVTAVFEKGWCETQNCDDEGKMFNKSPR